MAAYGYSRDGRPQNRQVLAGVVRVDGWPIAHHVFGGKRRDAQTVEQVLDDVRQRCGLERVVWVSDRGMMRSNNVALLRRRGQGYWLGLNRRRRNRSAFQQTLLGEQLQHPGEHFAVRFDVDQAARTRDRRMIGRGFVELDGEKAPQRDRIGQAPSDAALAVDAFEVTNQQAAEVAARGHRRTTHARRVELLTALFGELVEAVLVEQLVEPAIKRMSRCLGQIRGGDPEPFLPLPPVASSHCHETIIH